MKQEELLLECPHCGSTHIAKQKLLFDLEDESKEEVSVCLSCWKELD
jgi:hypothetical protein